MASLTKITQTKRDRKMKRMNEKRHRRLRIEAKQKKTLALLDSLLEGCKS